LRAKIRRNIHISVALLTLLFSLFYRKEAENMLFYRK